VTSPDTAALVLRVIVGITIIAHGYNHIFGPGGIQGTAGWFASMGLRPGTQMRVREPSGPSTLHLLVVDPSGLGESGGMERVVSEFEMDLSAVVATARRRPIGSRSRRLGDRP